MSSVYIVYKDGVYKFYTAIKINQHWFVFTFIKNMISMSKIDVQIKFPVHD